MKAPRQLLRSASAERQTDAEIYELGCIPHGLPRIIIDLILFVSFK